MKGIIVKAVCVLFVVAFMAACASTPAAVKDRERQELASNIKKGVEDRNFKIDVNFVTPVRFPAMHIDGGYELRVHGDSIYSYLPFFGRVYVAPYGREDQGLHFADTLSDYTVRRKKDQFIIRMTVRRPADTHVYNLVVFDNGNASVDVTSQQRERISYSGEWE